MTKIVGVRFQQAGKIYYFDPVDFDLEVPMHVIVETARGIEMGTVLIPPKEVEDDKVVQPLKPVIRIATDEDERTVEQNKEKEKEAFAICKEKILQHELEMKLVNAEYTFDSNKLLFYFTADGRIDFRELVKDLAAIFRTRIELRQIGVRDETKMMGGIGICGRELCCKSYLADFVPVSIKMAKEQNLSLNPTKISGVCGRLMCCLKNEQDTYEYLNSRLPAVGDVVTTKSGMKGEVMNVNVLRQLVKMIVDNGDEKELREVSVDDLNFRPKHRKDVRITEEELKELEGLEDVSDEIEDKKDIRKDRRDRNNREDREERNNRGNREEQEERDDRNHRWERNNRGNREERGNRGDRRERRNRGYQVETEEVSQVVTDVENVNLNAYVNIVENENRAVEAQKDVEAFDGLNVLGTTDTSSEIKENRESRGDRRERGNRYERGDRRDRGNRYDRGDRKEYKDRSKRFDRETQNEVEVQDGQETRDRQNYREKRYDRERKDYNRNRRNDRDRSDRNEQSENHKEYNGRNRNYKGRRNFDRNNERRNNENRPKSDSE